MYVYTGWIRIHPAVALRPIRSSVLNCGLTCGTIVFYFYSVTKKATEVSS
jgi:hypothetical protein